MQDFMNTYIVGNGWVGVLIGIVLFVMGYYKGLARTASIIPIIVDSTIQGMVADGYARVRKVLNPETGEWEEELLRHDEEI
jgi:general stress protein CsbA